MPFAYRAIVANQSHPPSVRQMVTTVQCERSSCYNTNICTIIRPGSGGTDGD